MKTIQEVFDMYGFTCPSQLNGTYWQGYDEKDNRVIVRFDKSAGWVEIFRLSEFQPISQG